MAAIHGRGVTPYGALVIADDYRLAGDVLGENGRTREDMPRRLLYLHAIEGYLRAHLLLTGATPESIRDHRHDLRSMLTACSTGGLGSGLIDQSQKMTVAAMQIADMKVWAQRS